MKKSEEYRVSVVKCSDYTPKKVEIALKKSLENINFEIKSRSKVIIKPNLLYAASPNKVITTHPVVLEELCKFLKKKKCEIIIGESSAYDTDKALEKCGVNKLKKYAKIINFEGEPKKFFDLGNNELNKVPFPKILFDVDMVINVAKLKTHGLTHVSLCVKNLYGCIPGRLKNRYHKVLPDVKKFSKLLHKIEDKIKPELNIIDGVVGLEGEGPGASGKPFKSRIIISGKKSGAVDIIASEIMGFNYKNIYTNKFSRIKKKNIEIIGDGKNIYYKFEKSKSAIIPIYMWFNKFMPKPKIKFNNKRCKRCGVCGKKCPVKAIKYSPFPECDYKKCIRCLCCIEICPYNAVYLEEHWFKKGLTDFLKKFMK